MGIHIGFVSLGCPKNQVDGEIMLNSLQRAGMTVETQPEQCDAVIINTCGFIESAKQEAIDTILEFAAKKGQGRLKKLIVTGCLAERYFDDIRSEMPEVDAVVGLTGDRDIVSIVEGVLAGRDTSVHEPFRSFCLTGERTLFTPPYTAYLKIADGCDNRCAYCAIPMIRGRFVSRPMEDIVAEAEALVKGGVKELIVVAQDTTRYGLDLYKKLKLPELLQKLDAIPGVRWVRVLYCYPELITDELIDTIKNGKHLCHYLDIPMQHSSEKVIRAMNRKFAGPQLLKLIEKLREAIPDITLRTTLLTGFPGETQEDFENLTAFVKAAQIDRLGCFAFSAEEGTKAFSMPDQLPEEVKQHRAEIVGLLATEVSERLAAARVGRVIECVCEGTDDSGRTVLRSCYDAPDIDTCVYLEDNESVPVGTFLPVTVTGTMGMDLLGRPVNATDSEGTP